MVNFGENKVKKNLSKKKHFAHKFNQEFSREANWRWSHDQMDEISLEKDGQMPFRCTLKTLLSWWILRLIQVEQMNFINGFNFLDSSDETGKTIESGEEYGRWTNSSRCCNAGYCCRSLTIAVGRWLFKLETSWLSLAASNQTKEDAK